MPDLRYVVVGAGAVGGALAAQLVPAGHEVVLVARGEHGRLLRERGLVARRPDRVDTVPVTVAAGPEEVDLREDDVLLLTVKAQDAEAVLAQWAWLPVHDAAGHRVGVAADLPVVTYQNGMLTEDLALRRFSRVYGATIAIAASYLTPGEIVSPSEPPAVGLVWLGRHPGHPDPFAARLVADLVGAGFSAWLVEDVRAHKAAKLVGNVGNGLDLLSGADDVKGRARERLRKEAEVVLRAADVALPDGGGLDLHGVAFSVLPVEGHLAGRLSTWQSFARGASSEIDYLNGEIVLLARQAGTVAPLNARLQQLLGADLPAEDLTVERLLEEDVDDVAV